MVKSDKQEFFDRLAVEQGTMSTEGVIQAYNALVRLIIEDLLSGKKVIALPDIGTLTIAHSDKETIKKFNPRTKIIEEIRNSPSLRFSADYKLKKYCKFVHKDV